MNKSRYYTCISIIFLTIVSLSFFWEFWLEAPVLGLFNENFEPESLEERWEYIITTTIFVCLSLIYPTVIGGKIISKQERQYEEIKRLGEQDYLTGFYNRRKINGELVREVNRGKRYGNTFSTILLDIDCFKEINDEFGHTVGDGLLVEISEVIRSAVRACDIIGRWGGEEFIILCPETNRDSAYFLAEKLRRRIEGHNFHIVGYKTVSAGVAEYRAGDDIEVVVIKADKALYSAKGQGKNRVIRAAVSGAL
jgi:diguanylate cyclase (GGDEF)-like protein